MARSDLPLPDGPRSNTPAPSIATVVACIVIMMQTVRRAGSQVNLAVCIPARLWHPAARRDRYCDPVSHSDCSGPPSRETELAELLFTVAPVVAPVFVVAATGFVWARAKMPFDTEFTTALVSNLAFPCLIVSTLANLEIDVTVFSQMAWAGILTVLLTGAAAAAILKISGSPQPVYWPSLVFGNVGNMGLPLCLFAFGEQGLALGIIFFTVFVAIQFTLGISVAAGRFSARILVRTPLTWACLLGIVMQLAGIGLPRWIGNTIGLVGDLAIPLMLLTLGIALANLKVASLRRSALMSLARLLLGLAVGLAVAHALGLEGAARGVLILESTMPVAVLNYLFAARYDRSPEEIAGLVLVSTAISFVTLPALLLIVL